MGERELLCCAMLRVPLPQQPAGREGSGKRWGRVMVVLPPVDGLWGRRGSGAWAMLGCSLGGGGVQATLRLSQVIEQWEPQWDSHGIVPHRCQSNSTEAGSRG